MYPLGARGSISGPLGHSPVSLATSWWLAAGVNPVMAYDAGMAASYTESKLDKMLTYNLSAYGADPEPTWSSPTGWGYEWSTNRLLSTASFGFSYDTITVIAQFIPAVFPIGRRLTLVQTSSSQMANCPSVEIGAGNGSVQRSACVIVPGVFCAHTVGDVLTAGVDSIVGYSKNGPGATHAFYIDGNPVALIVNAAVTYAGTADVKLIGARMSGGMQNFYGSIKKVVIFSSALSAAQHLTMRTAMAAT